MKISDFMHDKILIQKWANDLVKNADLLDEVEALKIITCPHCGKEFDRNSEDGEWIEKYGMCFTCDKIDVEVRNSY